MCRLSKESINCFTERAVEERILIPLRLNSRVSFVPVNLFRSNFYYNLYLLHLTNQNSPKFIYIHIKIHLVASYEMKTENLKTSRCKQRVGKRGEAKEREECIRVFSLHREEYWNAWPQFTHDSAFYAVFLRPMRAFINSH